MQTDQLPLSADPQNVLLAALCALALPSANPERQMFVTELYAREFARIDAQQKSKQNATAYHDRNLNG